MRTTLPSSALARSGAEGASQAVNSGLFAPGALVSVAQVAGELQARGMEFRELGRSWLGRSGWRPLSAEKLEAAHRARRPVEMRSGESAWVRVTSMQGLAGLLNASDVAPAGASQRAQGLAASAGATAASAAGALAGLAGAAIPQQWSCPFRLLQESPRVSTASFALGLAKHMSNPVEFFGEFHAEHGDHFQVNLPTGQRFLFDHRPETVREALKVTDHPRQANTWHKPEMQGHGLAFLMGMDNAFLARGSEWRKTHEVMQPTLNAASMHSDDVVAGVGRTFQRHIDRWKEQARDGEVELDLRQEMQLATLDVAFQTVLGTELPEARLRDCQKAFATVMKWLPKETANPTDFSLSRLPGNSPLREAYATLTSIADSAIEARQAGSGPDALGALLQATDPDTGKPFSRERVRNEVLMLMLAGHETTATLLSWSFAELARHPQQWRQLQGQVDGQLGGRFPGFKELKGITAADQVTQETLRLYSPAYFLVREASEDTTLGPAEATLPVKQGTQLVMSTFHMHRDPENWGPDAAEFKPERFDRSKGGDERGLMVPFGTGARVCIGQHLAKLEANLLLTRVAQEFDLGSKAGEALGVASDISVHPSDARVKLKLRSDAPHAQAPPAASGASTSGCPFLAGGGRAGGA